MVNTQMIRIWKR